MSIRRRVIIGWTRTVTVDVDINLWVMNKVGYVGTLLGVWDNMVVSGDRLVCMSVLWCGCAGRVVWCVRTV